jgi:hypothetical protein
MSLLEKYLEGKKEMYAKFDEIREACDEAIDAAGGEFLEKFKEMIAGASDAEFHEFMCNSGDELDEIERIAALTARLESYGKRCKDEENEREDKPKKNDGPHVMIIGIG